MVEAVVFDIGNVLIEWRPERHYDRHMPRSEREEMFAELDLHAMNDAIDRGAPFRETVYEFAQLHPRWSAQIRLWHDDWLEMAAPAIGHSLSLLRALRARGVPVFALSNFGIGTFEIASKAYPFLHEFDRAFISGHLGIAKPDAEIYARLEAESGLSGAQLLFTDDRADNIAVAQQRGWKTHLFALDPVMGPAGWAQRLVDEELLSPEEAACPA